MKNLDDILNGQRLRCWDFGSTATDRYTIAFMSQPPIRSRLTGRIHRNCLVSGMDPRGCSGHEEVQIGRHLGKRLSFNQLPQAVQSLVLRELTTETRS
jgi:hypothetical protein